MNCLEAETQHFQKMSLVFPPRWRNNKNLTLFIFETEIANTRVLNKQGMTP